ncbi:MAG: cobyric acid synthase CobQ, partial [Burkholderia sp.]|nr:cobyric acid synthase CobQ [Burkholderia sp.]
TLDDPLGLEGAPGSVPGLALLDFDTTLQPDKTLKNVTGHVALPGGAAVRGYEIHMGDTRGPALAAPALMLAADDAQGGARPDGAISADGQILATYVHGLFDAPDACAALLAWAGLDGAERIDYPALREASLERLADTFADHLDLDALYAEFR